MQTGAWSSASRAETTFWSILHNPLVDETFPIVIGAAEKGTIALRFDGTWIGDDGRTGERFRLILEEIQGLSYWFLKIIDGSYCSGL